MLSFLRQRGRDTGGRPFSCFPQCSSENIALFFAAQLCGVIIYKKCTMRKTVPVDDSVLTESEEVFEKAAEVFRVMSAPMRLRIISALCNGEKNVGELLAEIDTTQPNMSQHLNTLYQAGVLGKRREGVQIFYRIVNDRVVTLCRAVCVQIASDTD
ncbi:MAG: Biofilm growth-associated repressor [Pseudomonadota bacterium]|jgi:DNA-binding transcriptional ArsR family regulator